MYNSNSQIAIKNELPKYLKHNEKLETVEIIKLYNLLGNVYHNDSDIGEAYNYWKKAFQIAKNKYGSNSIYLAESYALLSKYHSFRINKDSALYFAEKGMQICRSKSDSLSYIPVNLIYREYAYAAKIKWRDADFISGTRKARVYIDSTLYFTKIYFPDNKIKLAQCYQDYGNSYTDEILIHSYNKDTKQAKENYIKANFYYDKAIAIRNINLPINHERLSTLYYVKGITEIYVDMKNGKMNSLKWIQKAIHELDNNFDEINLFALAPKNISKYKTASLNTLLSEKILNLTILYEKTKNVDYIKTAYNHAIYAEKVWQQTVENMLTHEIHQALNIYNSAPFNVNIPCAVKYHEAFPDKAVLKNIYKWMDLNKFVTLRKLDYKIGKNDLSNISVDSIQNSIAENQCILNIWDNGYEFYCILLTKTSIKLFLKSSINASTQIDSINNCLISNNEKLYCKKSKIFYDNYLKEIFQNLPSHINDIVIIPFYPFSKTSFESVVTNDCNRFTDANYLFDRFNISYKLFSSSNDNASDNMLSNNINLLSPQFNKMSRLKFSETIFDNLNSLYSIKNFDFSHNTNDGIMHLNTHCYFNNKESRESYFMLNDYENMTLEKFNKLNLKYKLGVFAACETARGSFESGEGEINMPRFAYMAGCKGTISSLWKIDDKTTSEILTEFYKNLAAGLNTKEALYTAKETYFKNATSDDALNPYYWSGLIYTGENLIMKTGQEKNNYLLIGSVALLIVILTGVLLKLFFNSN